ncbi:MAG: hypothetical protein FWB73_00355 [Treponema sp.]|nr:hypothetical protein [Treponema sp.]
MASLGLGKNSPVVLSFGKESYEALIERHGQFVRWRIATKCPCATEETGQPNPRCKRCGGRGVMYGHQAKVTVTQTVMSDVSGIVEVADEYENCALDFIYDFQGVKFKDAVKTGKYISLNSPVMKGTYVYAVMIKDIVKKVSQASCEKLGAGYYRVNGIRSHRNGIDGLYHTAPGDLVKIGKIIDANNVVYEAKELRTDIFFIKPPVPEEGKETIEIAEPITAYDIDYIPPFLFAIANQNMSKADEQALIKYQGDAVCTFPYSCDVADDDVITVLSGTVTKKEVKKRVANTDDTIGVYFVQEIVTCMGNNRDFIQGVDFILTGTNRIKWLCEDAPDVGETYSITYRENPTYTVAKAVPQLRTSENQRLPKKAVLKWHTTYADKKKVNEQ